MPTWPRGMSPKRRVPGGATVAGGLSTLAWAWAAAAPAPPETTGIRHAADMTMPSAFSACGAASPDDPRRPRYNFPRGLNLGEGIVGSQTLLSANWLGFSRLPNLPGSRRGAGFSTAAAGPA